MSQPPGITRALSEALDRDGQEHFLALVHGELKRIARAELKRHRRGPTLDTHALVNEAYLKLFNHSPPHFENRSHFYATAARAMRQVIIDYARGRLAERRGGGVERVPLKSFDALEGQPLPIDAQTDQLLAIDAALTKLEKLDPRLARIVELRFFAGMGVTEIATILGLSEPTIKRDTRAAKAFLQRELGASGS